MRSDKTGRSQTAATALQVSVAAPVRARSTGFKPKDRIRMTNSGAQWTARPTLTLRLRALR